MRRVGSSTPWRITRAANPLQPQVIAAPRSGGELKIVCSGRTTASERRNGLAITTEKGRQAVAGLPTGERLFSAGADPKAAVLLPTMSGSASVPL
jgi:hypothetical protein